MKNRSKSFWIGFAGMISFVIWTILVQTVDVQPAGVNGTNIGLAAMNTWFHQLTGVHMWIYDITDLLSFVPFLVCLGFAGLGLVQLIQRKNLLKVDSDILFLGIHYLFVIASYLLFEMIPINYRPILIEGVMEVSYPSSTTLLVLGVMPTLMLQAKRRVKNTGFQQLILWVTALFSAFMVIGRLIAGVHWISDIIGSVFLSASLLSFYLASINWADKKANTRKQ